uniref:Uncharacterized protein n=1 Tax=Oryza brachyantha TaxID=4533 RepID=J3MID5_ORYBR
MSFELIIYCFLYISMKLIIFKKIDIVMKLSNILKNYKFLNMSFELIIYCFCIFL